MLLNPLVQQARIGARWIACDCLGAEVPPPILTPAFLSEAETYYLRRLTGARRPEHLPDCPFFRDQVTNRITQTRIFKAPADPPAGFFEVLRPAPEKLAQRPLDDGSDDRTRSASIPRLARLLWRLLDLAGLNTIPPISGDATDQTIAREFQALNSVAAKIEIAPGIELQRALWTHGQALHSRRAYATLRELARRWPGGHAPQGFLAIFAQQFTGTQIFAPGCDPIMVVNRVQSPSVRGNPIKGPYLVLIVVGEYPETRGYAPLRAYAQPIFAGNRFIPIDTEDERRVLRSLLDVRRDLHRDGIEIAIRKPVFDMLTEIGPSRPSFQVEARSRLTGEIREKVINLQAEGLPPDPQTRHAMGKIAPVIDMTPDELENDGLRGRLAAALWG